MNHDELIDSLARLKGAMFKDISLGSVWLAQDRHRQKVRDEIRNGNCNWEDLRKPGNGIPRADLVVIRPSYDRFCIDIFEIKVNRFDFLSDIKTKKWEKYLPFCHRFYFAILNGVAKKKEIPSGVGLYEFGRVRTKSWSLIKGAKHREIRLPEEYLLSIIFYKQNRFIGYQRKLEALERYADKKQ